MSVITLIAYKAIIENNNNYQMRKGRPFNVLNKAIVEVRNIDDIEHEANQNIVDEAHPFRKLNFKTR